jgi:hypothetical protein
VPKITFPCISLFLKMFQKEPYIIRSYILTFMLFPNFLRCVSFLRKSCEGYIGHKVKVKLSLCFNWARRHEGVLGEWTHSSTHSLTSALDKDEWSASRPGRYMHIYINMIFLKEHVDYISYKKCDFNFYIAQQWSECNMCKMATPREWPRWNMVLRNFTIR